MSTMESWGIADGGGWGGGASGGAGGGSADGGTWVSDFFEALDAGAARAANGFICAQGGAFGIVGGACFTGDPDLIFHGGIGNHGLSITAGYVANGSSSGYLTGFSSSIGNVVGFGTTADYTFCGDRREFRFFMGRHLRRERCGSQS